MRAGRMRRQNNNNNNNNKTGNPVEILMIVLLKNNREREGEKYWGLYRGGGGERGVQKWRESVKGEREE
jgi:hypothetical protein